MTKGPEAGRVYELAASSLCAAAIASLNLDGGWKKRVFPQASHAMITNVAGGGSSPFLSTCLWSFLPACGPAWSWQKQVVSQEIENGFMNLQ